MLVGRIKSPMKQNPSLIHILQGGAALSLFALLTSCQSTYPDNHSTYRGNAHANVTTYRTGGSYKTLPPRYKTMDVDGRSYYYSNGSYFQQRGTGYVVVDRPFRSRRTTTNYKYGQRYDRVPGRSQRVRYGNREYYHSDGHYYRPQGNAYVTVRSPFG